MTNFLTFGSIFENNEKAFQFCQTRNLIPSNDRKDCVDCGAEGKVSVCKYSRNENFPYELRCSAERDQMYIFQFIYTHEQKAAGIDTPRKMFDAFLTDISKVYPGYGRIPLAPVNFCGLNEVDIFDDDEDQDTE
ncbi:hypothetical protein C0J52_27284 [Blattella germanica]|nr:hypothetical protein C0J52_27284 [Blattella germanica]